MNQKPASSFRLDEQVFLTMAALCVLSIIVLAFRFTTRTVCRPFAINISSEKLIEDRPIEFRAAAFGVKSYRWNFGDGVEKEEITPSTNHTYVLPGTYTITLTISGSCSKDTTIFVEKGSIEVVAGPAKIFCPDTVYVDEMVQFTDGSVGANAWDWAFEEPNRIDAKIQNPTFTYSTTGPKTVSLRINGRDDLTAARRIMVIKRQDPTQPSDVRTRRTGNGRRPPRVVIPETPIEDPLSNPTDSVVTPAEKPPVIVAPKVSPQQLASMLTDVLNGRKAAQDFSDYLCNDLSIEVIYENKKMPFTEFCATLKGFSRKDRKRVKDINVTPTVNGTTNCIKSMTVTINSRSGFWPFN